MPTRDELRILQALPLDMKIRRTKQRIKEWVRYYGEDGVYVSFSGGKDSTVLLDIVRKLYPQVEAVFVNTGLEYPEIQSFVKTFDNVTILRPKMRFDEVIRKHGYPIISKEVSKNIAQYKNSNGSGWIIDRWDNDGEYNKRFKNRFSLEKWIPLRDNADFLISSKCCDFMKKNPAKKFEKETGKNPIMAIMAEESALRTSEWLKRGCNAFDGARLRSNPVSFWTEQDILLYIKENNLPIAIVYGDIDYDNDGAQYAETLCDCGCKLKTTGCDRTGCIFCGFGAHLEKGESRFQRLKRTHPRQYEYCLEGGAYDTDGLWKPANGGLGMKHVFDEVNKIYGDDFIRYE